MSFSPKVPNSPALSTTSSHSAPGGPSNLRSVPLNPAPPPSPRNKPRARELLRKHYGLARTSSGGSGSDAGLSSRPDSRTLGRTPSGNIVERPNDPLNLDSPAFDPKLYYEDLITNSSLTQLLQRENELLTEIRQLEGERQSLVYNRHHELIEASDTIAAMKARAESLDDDLDKLQAAFSEISRLGTELGSTQP